MKRMSVISAYGSAIRATTSAMMGIYYRVEKYSAGYAVYRLSDNDIVFFHTDQALANAMCLQYNQRRNETCLTD